MFSSAEKGSRRPVATSLRTVVLLAIITIVAFLARPGRSSTLAKRAGIKVMIVGDSISQGHEGDYTWRYRMWQWFKSNDVEVDLVGPYVGTLPPEDPLPPQPPRMLGDPEPIGEVRAGGGYAADIDADFDKDHFSLWGRQAAQDITAIGSQVSTYQPDYLLVELGFNDLGWFISGPQGTLNSMRLFVDSARTAKPNLRFAVANVPFRTYIGGRDDLPVITDKYNALLAEALPQWSTSSSPIELVKFRETYSCELDACPSGHDGLHPNARGEFEIALAFSRTLHDKFGLGHGELSIPADIPTRPCPVPVNFRAASGPAGIAVTWDKVYGAYAYNVRNRRVGSSDWQESVWDTVTNRFDTTGTWTEDGVAWEYMARAVCGDTVKSDWTGIVSAVAHPQTAPGPKNVFTQAMSNGVFVSWDALDGGYNIDRYAVSTFDRDVKGAFIESVGVRDTQAIITGLTPGHHYIVAVSTWTDIGGGPFTIGRSVSVGYSTPPAPTDLKVITRDGATVQLQYGGSPAAAGYRFWIRNINNASDVSKADFNSGADSGATCWGITYLMPGAWNYEFCVSAFNGNSEGTKSACVVAPQDVTPVGDCPPPPGPTDQPFPGVGDENGGAGGTPPDGGAVLSPADPEPSGVCSMEFNSGDPAVNEATWVNSGAMAYLFDLLLKDGVVDWTRKFFRHVIANGTQGGATFDCTDFPTSQCQSPGATPCISYTPPGAFYIHISISNLYNAFINFHQQMVTTAISELSHGIKQIVDDFGTPPKEENVSILTLLIGILVSLAGIEGTIGQVGLPPNTPTGITDVLGKFGNPLTIMVGVLNLAASPVQDDAKANPAKLNDQLETAMGVMFDSTLKAVNDTVHSIFSGIVPSNVAEPPLYIAKYFLHGAFLDQTIVDPMVNTYIANTVRLMKEAILIKALKSGVKHQYFLATDPASDTLNENVCSAKRGCVWYKNNCVCFGRLDGTDPFTGQPISISLSDNEVKTLSGYVLLYSDALKNNFDCSDAGTGDPTFNTFDYNNPVVYPKCFWNLRKLATDNPLRNGR